MEEQTPRTPLDSGRRQEMVTLLALPHVQTDDSWRRGAKDLLEQSKSICGGSILPAVAVLLHHASGGPQVSLTPDESLERMAIYVLERRDCSFLPYFGDQFSVSAHLGSTIARDLILVSSSDELTTWQQVSQDLFRDYDQFEIIMFLLASCNRSLLVVG